MEYLLFALAVVIFAAAWLLSRWATVEREALQRRRKKLQRKRGDATRHVLPLLVCLFALAGCFHRPRPPVDREKPAARRHQVFPNFRPGIKPMYSPTRPVRRPTH